MSSFCREFVQHLVKNSQEFSFGLRFRPMLLTFILVRMTSSSLRNANVDTILHVRVSLGAFVLFFIVL